MYAMPTSQERSPTRAHKREKERALVTAIGLLVCNEVPDTKRPPTRAEIH